MKASSIVIIVFHLWSTQFLGRFNISSFSFHRWIHELLFLVLRLSAIRCILGLLIWSHVSLSHALCGAWTRRWFHDETRGDRHSTLSTIRIKIRKSYGATWIWNVNRNASHVHRILKWCDSLPLLLRHAWSTSEPKLLILWKPFMDALALRRIIQNWPTSTIIRQVQLLLTFLKVREIRINTRSCHLGIILVTCRGGDISRIES